MSESEMSKELDRSTNKEKEAYMDEVSQLKQENEELREDIKSREFKSRAEWRIISKSIKMIKQYEESLTLCWEALERIKICIGGNATLRKEAFSIADKASKSVEDLKAK